jgi:hypothetical protein
MDTRKTIRAVAMAALASGTALGADSGRNFKARLVGPNEVPPVTDTAAKATASFRFNSDFTRLKFTFQLRGGEDITEAHLHCAPAGAHGNGPIIVSLFGLAGPATVPLLGLIHGGFNGSLNVTGTLMESSIVQYSSGGTSVQNRGCGSAIGRDITNFNQLVEAMRNGEIYVNAHSVAHPAGVVRGDVRGKGQSSTSGGTSGTGTGTGVTGTGTGMGGTGGGGTGSGGTGTTGLGYGGIGSSM